MPKNPWTYRKRKKRRKTRKIEIYETDAATIEQFRSVDRVTSEHEKENESSSVGENVPKRSPSNVLETTNIKTELEETTTQNFSSNMQPESMLSEISSFSSLSASQNYNENFNNSEELQMAEEMQTKSVSVTKVIFISEFEDCTTQSREISSQTLIENVSHNIQPELLSSAISPYSLLNTSNNYDENCKRKNPEVLPIAKRIKTEPMDMVYDSEISLNRTEEMTVESSHNAVMCEDSTAQSKASINIPANIDGNFKQKIKQEQLGEDSNSNLNEISPELPNSVDFQSTENPKKSDGLSDECVVIEKPKIKYEIIDLSCELNDISTTCAQTFNSADKFYKNEKSTDKSYSFPKPKVTVKTEQDTISVTSINRDLPSTVSNSDIDLNAQHTHVRNQEYSTTVVSVFEKSINSNHNNDVQMYSENSDEECSEKESCNDEDCVRSNSIFSDECIITESLPVSKVNEKEYQSSQMDSSDGRPYHHQFPTPLLGYIRKHIILDMAKVSEMKPLINKLKIENKRRNKERLQEKPETELGPTFETLYFLERSESPIIDYEEESPAQQSFDEQVAENSTLNKLMNITSLPSYSSGMEEMGKPGLKNVDQINLVDSDQSNVIQNIGNTSLTFGVPSRSSDFNSMSHSLIETHNLSVHSFQKRNTNEIGSPTPEHSSVGCVNCPLSKEDLRKIINNVTETANLNDESNINIQKADSKYDLSSVNNQSFLCKRVNHGAAASYNDLCSKTLLNRNNTNVLSADSHSANVKGDIFETTKRMKQSPKMGEVPTFKDSKIKKISLEEYRKKNWLNPRDPRRRTRPMSIEGNLTTPVLSPHFISNNLPSNSPAKGYSPSIAPNYPVSSQTPFTPMNTFSSDHIQGFPPNTNSRNFNIPVNVLDYPQNTNLTFRNCDYSPFTAADYLQTRNSVTTAISSNPSQNYPSLITVDHLKSILTTTNVQMIN
ncbi:hypothetical protein NPIL_407001 [Nephila pilipes]|uniref:Uncharacterized protein n=1 Tax=Nephila pilipes TaxID=299642 RepID=A0A8X6P7J0_NEPPI|nr:hypothetical protein NPIL_407001 [Nephila pilipes]